MSSIPFLPFLGWVFDATVKGAVVIVLIALVQQLLAGRIAAHWRHALWLVVLVRLAIPAAPSSPWSIFNLFEKRDALQPAVITVAPERSGAPFMVQELSEDRIAELPASLLVWRWIGLVWAFGAVLLLLRTAIATVRIQLAVRHALLNATTDFRSVNEVIAEAKRRLRISAPVRTVESDIVKAPALHGLIRPTLILPVGLASSFDRAELHHVVLHELWHLRRFDVVINWVLAVVEALHWFNPFVWFAVSRIQEERELACDELALSCLEEDERLGYGRTILKLLERFREPAPVPALVGIVNRKEKMKRRLTMITQFRNRSRFPILFVATIAAVGALGLTDARGGERKILRKLDPAAVKTLERLDQRITFDVTDASLGELLSLVSNKTGVAVTQSPEVATSAAQKARFTIKAENVPAHAVLMESLMPLKLAPEPDANGITISDAPSCTAAGHKVVMRREIGVGEKHDAKVIVRAEGQTECKLKADGSFHRELDLNIDENGVSSEGRLVIDVTNAQ